MSFNNFKKYLNLSLDQPRLLKSNWEHDSTIPPHIPNSFEWISTDFEEAFTSLLKVSFHKLKDDRVKKIDKKLFDETINYYLNNPIEYKLNEFRFRSDTFSLNIEGNLFLGCSDTFGIGHNLENTWPYILTQLRFSNNNIYNLSTPGAGSDTNFRHLTLLKGSFKIKNIFHWLPFRNRFEYFIGSDIPNKTPEYVRINNFLTNSEFNIIAPQYETSNEIFSEFYIKNGLSTNVARNINVLKNISAIKEISNELDVPYYISNFEIGKHTNDNLHEVLDYFDKNNIPRKLLARDFSHGSVYDNAKIVANFLNLIDAPKLI